VQYTIVVDQLALKRWHGKIDALDALIVSFVAGLNPHNQAVARRMHAGMFELSREWIRQEIPLLDVSADWIGRRLATLRKMGVLDLKTERVGSHFHTYGRLSRLYFAEVERAKKAADAVRVERDSTPSEPDSERDPGPGSRGENSLYHSKISEEAVSAPPPLVVGDAGPETSPDRAMTEAEFKEIAQRVPWRQTASTPTVIDFKMRQTGEREEAAV
jgi:hypothetical protein